MKTKKLKFIFVLFLIGFYGCSKDFDMKESEKFLIENLKEQKIKAGKIHLTIKNNYFAIRSNTGIPNTFTVTQLNYQFLTPVLQYFPNAFIFGFNDLQSNFKNALNNCPLTIGENQSTRNTDQESYDNNNFYPIKDNNLKYLLYSLNFNGLTDIQIPINAVINNEFQNGDLLISRFSIPKIYGGGIQKEFIIVETLITCEELPYLNLCEMINDSDLQINNFTYDFSNSYNPTFSNKSLPSQKEIPITLLRSNIFGQNYTDTLNPLVFMTENNYQINKVLIPLKTKGKNLLFSIPLAFDIKEHYFTFTIQLNN